MATQFMCDILEGNELTAATLERCWGHGRWSRDPATGRYSYQTPPMEVVAAAIGHSAGPSINDLANWAIEAGEYDDGGRPRSDVQTAEVRAAATFSVRSARLRTSAGVTTRRWPTA